MYGFCFPGASVLGFTDNICRKKYKFTVTISYSNGIVSVLNSNYNLIITLRNVNVNENGMQ